MKRLLAVVLSLGLCLCLFSAVVPAKAAAEEELIYQMFDGQVTVTGHVCGSRQEYVIPDTIEGYPVTAIGYEAFYNCSCITELTIPGSVTVIEKSAFAFSEKLTKLTISEGVIRIEKDAFFGCDKLEQLTIPDSVAFLGDSAFSCCEKLEEVFIPKTVTQMGSGVFTGCTNMTGIWVEECHPFYKSDSLGVCYSKDGTQLLQVPASFSGHFTVPEEVKLIGPRAFFFCENLTGVTIADSVTTIGAEAFFDCRNLTNLTIPDSVTDIAINSFTGCHQLQYEIYDHGQYLGNENIPYRCLLRATDMDITEIIIHPQTKIIGRSAFAICDELTQIRVPEGVTHIGAGAFSGIQQLTAVTIGDSVVSIGDHAFMACPRLSSVTVPKGVIKLGQAVFTECKSLTEIRVEPENSSYQSDSAGVLYSKDGTVLLEAPGLISGHYPIPEGVTTIAPNAFSSCHELTGVTIPESVTSIGQRAFYFCSGLTGVTIPKGVTVIEEDTFGLCESLVSAILPEGLTAIGKGAFSNCSLQKGVQIPQSVKTIGASAFSGSYELTDVTVPKTVAHIGYAAFAGCKELMGIWVDSKNPFYKSDSMGVLYSKDETMLIQAPGGIRDAYTVHGNVRSIGPGAFSQCYHIPAITIEEGVRVIESDAFASCSITSMTIPKSVKRIGSYAFVFSGVSTLYFAGDAPAHQETMLFHAFTTVFYHAGAAGWEDVRFPDTVKVKEAQHICPEYTYDQNHSCTEDGTERAVCLYCGETDVRKAENTARHRYNDGVCTVCGEADPSDEAASLTCRFPRFGEVYGKLTLTAVGATVPTASFSASGDRFISGYTFEAIPTGVYYLTAEKDGYVSRTYAVTLVSGKTNLEIRVRRPGDLNGDEKVTVGDVARLYAHVKSTLPLDDDYLKACADLSGDSRINLGDVSRLLKAVKAK